MFNDVTMDAIRFGQSLAEGYREEEGWDEAVLAYRDLLGEGAPGACVALHTLGFSEKERIKEILSGVEVLPGGLLAVSMVCRHEARAHEEFMQTITRMLALCAATLPPAPPEPEPESDD